MTKTAKAPKEKLCSICKEWFQPFSGMSPKVCGIPCAIKLTQINKKKEFSKKARKARKVFNNNDRSYLLDKAQKACNAYIRERDKHLPCISCGTNKPDIQYCAGHFKTRGGHPELRFSELNIFKQCNKYCNLSLSGNIAGYRPRLIERIGIDKVNWLESYHEPQKLSLDDIKEIAQYYKERLKAVS